MTSRPAGVRTAVTHLADSAQGLVCEEFGGADVLRFDVVGTATTRSRDPGHSSPALSALSAPSAPPAEPALALKQASILFLDVVGSTSLSQHLDPEATSGVSDGAMARCAGVIEWHRGKVMQYAGDRQAYGNALQRALDIDAPEHHDASAGLARVALADGDTAAALAGLQPVLDHIASGSTLEVANEVPQIELTVHQALALAQDPSAAEWLARAHGALMAGRWWARATMLH